MHAGLKWFFAWMGLLVIGSAVPAVAGEEAPNDGVFIHLSSGLEEPHRVLMALSMATIMSESKDVLIYCDIKGIEICLADAPDLTYAQFTPLKEALAGLLERGVTVMACPGCLKAAGKTADDLAEGIQVANKDQFFDFTAGRILSLDY